MDVRREVLEFGLLPASILPANIDSLAAITEMHSRLLKETETVDGQTDFRQTGVQTGRIGSKYISKSRLTVRDIYLVSNTRENNGTRGAVPRVSSSITFASFLRKHLQILLYLIKDNPPELSSPAWSFPGSGSSGVGPVAHNQDTARYTIWITAEEVDRLDLLLAGRLAESRNSREAKGISRFLPCFRNRNGADMAGASGVEIAQCLKKSILDSEGETDSIGRICGVTKGTTVEGEGSFPNDQLVIRECQDSCIYALTPLACAKVTACSDCIIVLGPTSGCVIVENCTRIKMIYAATSTCITACHESILHLAATRSPYLIGDNRFLQLGPFNIDYERLGAHLEMSGLQIRPNRWDKPALLNWFKREDESSMSSRVSTSDGKNEAKFDDLIMHPDQLLPFTIPFKGAPGPLAGGAPSNPQSTWVNKLINGEGSGPVFPLSPDYARALTAKLRRVAELQESVGKAISDLNNRKDIQVAIQRYFKDWLFKTAKIRQVYDLAKLEQQNLSDSWSTSQTK